MPVEMHIDTRGMKDLMANLPGAVGAFLDAEAETAVTEMKLSFNTSPGGRTYYRRGVMHIASQPGFPPNIDTGTLRNSLQWFPAGNEANAREIRGVDYGLELEYGTARFGARPFIAPVLERLSRDVKDRLRAALEGAL